MGSGVKKLNHIQPGEGVISNIQHMTVHDGPGVRTEVFFKGCSLRCLWCSNPEGLSHEPEVGVFGSDCIGIDVCGTCLKACPAGALLAAGNRIAGIDREVCKKCLKCAGACPNSSLVVYGKHMTVSRVMEEILKDRSIYLKNRRRDYAFRRGLPVSAPVCSGITESM